MPIAAALWLPHILPMRLLLLLLLLAVVAPARPARGQHPERLELAELSEREKRLRELFLRSRQEVRETPTPTPERAKPTPAPRRTPEPTPTPVRKAEPAPTPVEIRKAIPVERSTPTPEPRRKETPPPTPEPRKPEPTKETPTPTPTPKKSAETRKESQKKPDAPIVIEKSGGQEDEGYVEQPKERRGFLFGLFGGGPKYEYLTPTVRAAIDDARIKRGRWKYIVVHNSGTRQGNAKIFDRYHKNVRKMRNGLAYHFVIGNGSSSGDGEIEIGSRWTRQINGGHVASDYLNNIALGICFVGDFNRDVPTEAQRDSLEELIDYLKKRLRTKVDVKAHRDINPKPTDCPGKRFPVKWLYQEF